jgi:hypothetical protein
MAPVLKCIAITRWLMAPVLKVFNRSSVVNSGNVKVYINTIQAYDLKQVYCFYYWYGYCY